MAKRPRPAEAKDEGEAAFLASYDASAYDRPSVAVDVVLVATVEGALSTLLIKRTAHPFKGKLALPGGFLKKGDDPDTAAAQVLRRKARLSGVFLEQLYTFGEPTRDPRTWVISIAYYALVDEARFQRAMSDEATVRMARIHVPWEGETGGPVELLDERDRVLPLAFDHADIIGMAVKRLRGKLDYAPVGFQLLAETFTLLELQRVHETVLGRPLNKDSFRRRMLASGQLEATGRAQSGVDHRPAELYRFARRSAV